MCHLLRANELDKRAGDVVQTVSQRNKEIQASATKQNRKIGKRQFLKKNTGIF